jgi:hypothetical protein
VIGRRLRGHREENTVTTMTVARDEGVRGIQARLNELEEEKARLLTRHHALSHCARTASTNVSLCRWR